ncbi:MAG: competence protein ComEC [Janthinobacterium sp.]|jgi:competence protein ComEC
MRTAILGFVAGAALLQTRAALPAHPAMALLGSAIAGAVFLAIAAGLRDTRAAHIARMVLTLLCGAALGFFWAAWLAQAALAPVLAPADEGRDLIVTGTIASLPYRFDGGVRFNFDVEKVTAGDNKAGDITAGKITIPPRLALAWYAAGNYRANRANRASAASAGAVPQKQLGTPIGDVQPGERWQLAVRLQRPHGNANPDGFDYEVWLLGQGLRATGYVRADQNPGSATGPQQQLLGNLQRNRRLDAFVPGIGNLVERSRAVLRARILRNLDGRQYAGVIVALVVGDQRAIVASDWDVFNRTGIGHLISISGLHITMIAALFALLASKLWRYSFFTHWQLPLILPAQKVAALCGVGTALLYVLLAGFGVPAQRTLYMLIVVASALWLGRIASVSHVLCAALGVVVLLDPWAVLWPGFWLSFGAVALILYASVGRIAARAANPASAPMGVSAAGLAAEVAPVQPDPLPLHQRLRSTLMAGAHTQYVVTLGLVPLTMLLFAQVSLVSPLANALAIPLISLVVTPLALLGSLLPAPLSTPLLVLAHALIALLAQLLHSLAALPLALWSAPLPSWWIFCWALAGTLWMLAPRGWPHRSLGLVAWIPLLSALPTRPPDAQMWVTAFDVGQGMALLIETSSHRLLYDTGPSYWLDSNGGSRVINPYLKARGIAALDAIIVTHSDSDHAGGALAVQSNVSVGWVASSLPDAHAIVKAAPLHRHCQAGQSWSWDGVRFDMLHPTAPSYEDPGLSPNARSCVLKITASGKSILLAGDIEAAQEAQLLDHARRQSNAAVSAASAAGASGSVAAVANQLRSDVLLAPHHGSGTSSTPAFLLAVQPELALFQVGHRNRYRHPKTEVFERYGDLGIRRLRTDISGAIGLQFGPTLTVTEYRQDHARYWYGR